MSHKGGKNVFNPSLEEKSIFPWCSAFREKTLLAPKGMQHSSLWLKNAVAAETRGKHGWEMWCSLVSTASGNESRSVCVHVCMKKTILNNKICLARNDGIKNSLLLLYLIFHLSALSCFSLPGSGFWLTKQEGRDGDIGQKAKPGQCLNHLRHTGVGLRMQRD